jgi:glycosyltransferase involved in cell wall biosynthesis
VPEPSSIAVVVPARDEVDHVRQCLAALAVAARGVTVPVRVVVVVNGTVDATATVARRQGVEVLEHDEPGVGLARATGFTHVLRGQDPDRTWIATTDADSRVPPGWLRLHADLAARGAEAVVGTIRLRAADRALHATWWAEYRRGIGDGRHRHVHGANLGVLGSAYLAAGGFEAVPAHEDASLVARLEATGAQVVRTVQEPVRTSARLHGRAPGGVAADLVAARPVTG